MIIPNKLDTFRYGYMTNRYGNRYHLTIHVYNYIARLLYRYINISVYNLNQCGTGVCDRNRCPECKVSLRNFHFTYKMKCVSKIYNDLIYHCRHVWCRGKASAQ